MSDMKPILPEGYRFLREGEPMLRNYLIWKYPGQWEVFGDNDDTNYPWGESYRPVCCLQEDS